MATKVPISTSLVQLGPEKIPTEKAGIDNTGVTEPPGGFVKYFRSEGGGGGGGGYRDGKDNTGVTDPPGECLRKVRREGKVWTIQV